MDFIFPALISFLITVSLIPLTIRFAKKYGLLDNPKIRPHPAHIQQRIVPRAGGLGPFFAILLSTFMFINFSIEITGILLGLNILLVIGLLDDKFKNFSPYIRLFGQFIAAVMVVFSGISIDFITNPLGGILYLNFPITVFNQTLPILFSDFLAIVWIVWVMNMINWSKGVDGQMPSITTVASFFLGLLSVKLTLAGDPNQINVSKLSFITTGASLGLLIFNWHPAKIFPGFSASAIFGFLIAVLSILSGAKLATAGLILLIPATDFAYTFIRRVLQGKSPVWGDRGHLHHKLLEMGLSHQKISLFYFFGSVILGAAALSLSSSGKLFAATLLAVVILGGIIWLNFFGDYLKRQDQDSG
ncbi:undecaprenyl/decaprenyl-phosphate alpha-N-acetylglucosaminyl 1-phosphate transferase [Candidatus Daviesbacteria bacterium]|nr:undecaprenyl/decaprenyl-phosphate alpha-N-acetylglucosaminyl 1-phosphate transferase [Candidatus Daviesbacteria bacterium]